MTTTFVLETAAQTPPPDARDQNGRFTPGNRGGSGNPFARQVAALRQALLDAVSPDDMAAVAQALVAKAKQGDVSAAKVLLAYLVGKPAPAPDPDRLAVDEVGRFRDQAGLLKLMTPLFHAPDPELFLTILRETRPAITGGLGGRLSAALRGPEKDLATPSAVRKVLEPGAAKPGNARQSEPPSANGEDGKQPPAALMGVLDLLLERMATLDKMQAEQKPVNGNGHAQPEGGIPRSDGEKGRGRHGAAFAVRVGEDRLISPASASAAGSAPTWPCGSGSPSACRPS